MAIQQELLNLQSKIFGYWKHSLSDDIYYFGHIPDDQLSGIVEITYKKGNVQQWQYSILKNVEHFEVHISNFEYKLYLINELEMYLIGPQPTGVHNKFEKLPNKISFDFPL